MQVANDTSRALAPKRIIAGRTVDAARDRVFRAFTEREEIEQWWGPRGFTGVGDVDVRKGGKLRFAMRSKVYPSHTWHGVYEDVQMNERLAFTSVLDDEPQHPMRIVITFDELGDAQPHTHVTVEHTFTPTKRNEGTEEGWRQMLERLDEFLQRGYVTG